jgi:hypothetical protein
MVRIVNLLSERGLLSNPCQFPQCPVAALIYSNEMSHPQPTNLTFILPSAILRELAVQNWEAFGSDLW